MTTYKTSSPAGDLLSLLPSIRQIYRLTGQKGVIYQSLNIVGQSLPLSPQPFQNSNGESIMMGKETFDMLIPLLESQEYISNLLLYQGEEIEYDFDKMRLETFVNQPLGCLNRWPFYVFPEMACDLSEPWLSVHSNNDFKDKIIINFTSRYRNHWINYFFLKEYESNIVFAGLPQEHESFTKQWNLNIPLYDLKDFYQLAIDMSSCRLFLGNASMMFQISEGLKIPRVLETFQPMPNVIPIGKNGYDAYHQRAIEIYVHKLFNK